MKVIDYLAEELKTPRKAPAMKQSTIERRAGKRERFKQLLSEQLKLNHTPVVDFLAMGD